LHRSRDFKLLLLLRIWSFGPRPSHGKEPEKRSFFRHPQLAGHCQDELSGQGLWKYVSTTSSKCFLTFSSLPQCLKCTLFQGHSAETSGGLLICLPREQAAAYCKDIEKQEGYQAWIIGIVEKGNRTARIIDKPRVIEVPAKEKEGGELW